ncbi:NucA/NucB deoxyribonuclease domain-containing protein [Rhodococcus sp. DT1]
MYITLMMRVQARQPTGVMFVDTEVVKVLPDSVAGTLTLNLRQFPPGVTAGNQIGSWQIPVAEGQPGFNEQVDIDSPYAGYYQEVSDFATDWVLDTPVPGMAQSTGTQYTDIVLRCDNAVGAFPGCVNPDYTPTLTFTGLSYINMNIGNHQSNTGVGATWGTPLHRGESPLAAVANRDAACNTNRDEALGEPPDGMVDPSCDEYPFASSVEGGGAASVLWVPLAENLSQGGQTSTFYQNNRVMPGDAFFVDYT